MERRHHARAAARRGVRLRLNALPYAGSLGALLLVVLLLAAPVAASDRASVAFSLQRNELLSERIGLKRQLKEIDTEIAAGERPVTVSGTIGRANTVHNMRARHVVRLRNRRQRLIGRIDTVDRRFDTLTDHVVDHYGEQPAWWSDIK